MDMEEYNIMATMVKTGESFCRCCLSGSDVELIPMQKSRFENNSKHFNYLDGFLECSGVQSDDLIEHVDNDPKICKLCMFNLESAFTFRALCRQANTILHQQQTMEKLTVEHETIDDRHLNVSVKAKPADAGAVAKKRSRTTQCIECGMYFSGPVAIHNEMYHPELAHMEFNCERCNKTFNNRMSLKNHMNQKCFRKSQAFTEDVVVEMPAKVMKLERPPSPPAEADLDGKFCCERCHKPFDNPSSLKHHRNQKCFRKSKGLDAVPVGESVLAQTLVSEQPDLREKFSCERCDKPFDNPLSLKHHRIQKCFKTPVTPYAVSPIPIKQEIEEEPIEEGLEPDDYQDMPEKFSCERCYKTFNNMNSLKQHRYQKCFKKSLGLHEQPPVSPAELLDLEGKFCCERCNKPFDNPISLKHHKNQKCFRKSKGLHDLPPVDLDVSVAQPIAPAAPLLDLDGKFCCERCTKTFDNPLSLKSHMHQKCFRKSKGLDVEPSVMAAAVLNQMPSPSVPAISKYCCPRCKKTFKNRTIFLNHKRQCYSNRLKRNGRLNLVADVDGPDVMYEDICGKKVKLYKCPECFKYMRDLVTHRQMHSDVRHNCELCDKSYKFKHDLQKHVVSFHRE